MGQRSLREKLLKNNLNETEPRTIQLNSHRAERDAMRRVVRSVVYGRHGRQSHGMARGIASDVERFSPTTLFVRYQHDSSQYR